MNRIQLRGRHVCWGGAAHRAGGEEREPNSQGEPNNWEELKYSRGGKADRWRWGIAEVEPESEA